MVDVMFGNQRQAASCGTIDIIQRNPSTHATVLHEVEAGRVLVPQAKHGWFLRFWYSNDQIRQKSDFRLFLTDARSHERRDARIRPKIVERGVVHLCPGGETGEQDGQKRSQNPTTSPAGFLPKDHQVSYLDS